MEGVVRKQKEDCGNEDHCKDESTKTGLIHGEDSHTRAELLLMLVRAGLFQNFFVISSCGAGIVRTGGRLLAGSSSNATMERSRQ